MFWKSRTQIAKAPRELPLNWLLPPPLFEACNPGRRVSAGIRPPLWRGTNSGCMFVVLSFAVILTLRATHSELVLPIRGRKGEDEAACARCCASATAFGSTRVCRTGRQRGMYDAAHAQQFMQVRWYSIGDKGCMTCCFVYHISLDESNQTLSTTRFSCCRLLMVLVWYFFFSFLFFVSSFAG
ncbi:hypothetical protein LX36DRAFT_332913 [Colletotrichum falcatum]|nr:hypothetical protein LX36DRAFT_332913 [Colletotrichum falcatum]